MTTQPTALELAETLHHKFPSLVNLKKAAAELRRQHQKIVELEAQLARTEWNEKAAAVLQAKSNRDDRTIEGLEAQLAEASESAQRWKVEHDLACKLVADMHHAAIGEISGPHRGVVEDVADLKTERDALQSRLAEIEKAEPVAWFNTAVNETVGAIAYEYEKHGLKAGTALYAAPVAASVVNQQLTTCKDCNGSGEMETGIGMMVCDTCGGHTVAAPAKFKVPIEPYREEPDAPHECQTEAEKTAFAYGWWKAMETAPALTNDDIHQMYLATYDGKTGSDKYKFARAIESAVRGKV